MRQIVIIIFLSINSLLLSRGQPGRLKEMEQYRYFTDSITSFKGYKNEDNKVVVEPIYTGAYEFYEPGYAVVELNGKYGIIDTTGKYIVPCIWDYIMYPFENGITRVTTGFPEVFNGMQPYSFLYTQGKSGYINERNEFVIPVEYSFIWNFGKDSIAAFTRGKLHVRKSNWPLTRNPYKGKWGLINNKGEVILPDDYYTYIGWAHGPYFRAMKGNRTTVIDKTGKQYIPLKYRKWKEFENEVSRLYDEWTLNSQSF